MSTKLSDIQITLIFFNQSRIQSTITKIIYNFLHRIIMTKEKERREEKRKLRFYAVSHHIHILHIFCSSLCPSLLTNFLFHLREERTQFTSTNNHRYITRHIKIDQESRSSRHALHILCLISSF